MDLPDIVRILQVVLGIGLVIFVHEAGHFLAARWCGVRVQVFSLGFGPPLLAVKRGPTTYQIALVPLGGYVKMAGDEPTAEGRAWARREELRAAGHEVDLPERTLAQPRDGDLYSKGVGQRFFIFSGGVLMNLAFGAVVFPILFAHGVPFTEPLIGTAPGGPAWRAGIEPGSRVLEVNGKPVFDLNHVLTAVALGDTSATRLLLAPPGGEGAPRTVTVVPEKDEENGIYRIGIEGRLDPASRFDVLPGSAAEEAGLRSGMQLVSVEGATPGLEPVAQLLEAAESGGGPIRVTARDGDELVTVVVEPRVAEGSEPILGVWPIENRVRALRANPDVRALGLREGDLVHSVNGRPVEHARDFTRALLASADAVSIVVRRDGRRLELSGPALDAERALRLADDVALEHRTDDRQIAVTPGWAAARAGIRGGDVVQRIDGVEVRDWQDIRERIRVAAAEGRELAFDLSRPAADPDRPPTELELVAAPEVQPLSYGIAPRSAEYVFQADGPVDALEVGLLCSWRFVEDTWLTLKRMVSGQVSSKNMGGIITISRLSYSWSEQGLAKLFFFLCMLSINLAILNVLPIPVLDGGHLMFLLIEKIKGSPPSDRFLGYSQMVGLVLILSLMVYVTYNDLARLFGPAG